MNTIATRLFLKLGHAFNLVMAELNAKEIRSSINIKPEMKRVLNRLYV